MPPSIGSSALAAFVLAASAAVACGSNGTPSVAAAAGSEAGTAAAGSDAGADASSGSGAVDAPNTDAATAADDEGGTLDGRYLYAALLGGTIGVYAIDDGHRRVKTFGPLPLSGTGVDVRGMCGEATTHRLFLSYMSSTGGHVVSVDLVSGAVLWTHDYSPGVDRGDIGPRGDALYVPTNEDETAPYELVVDPADGGELARVAVTPQSHDTDIGISGAFAYVETKSSASLAVVATATNQVVGSIGPFAGILGPHVVNGSDSLVVANIFGFFGFVVGDVASGAVVEEVPIVSTPDPGGSGLRQHGVAWRPDESEVWVTGGPSMHVFTMTSSPPTEAHTIALSGYDDTHWINFSIEGDYAYPSPSKNSGIPLQVIDTRTYAAVGTVDYSEDLFEVDFAGGAVTRVGDQFGIGRVP